jgi:bifunctional UDP-N-acetylglucosamine pyrophosphorylase/glucosamine-1-phosphate N-acetyltransferase
MFKNVQTIILAAGKSTRFNSGKTKLIEKICGQELIIYPLSLMDELSIPTTLVLGFQSNTVKQLVEKHYPHRFSYVEQQEPNGTAAAVRLTRHLWSAEDIFVIKADVPLVTTRTLEQLYKQHKETGAAISFISAHNGDPTGGTYSRVIKNDGNLHIKRHTELSYDEKQEHCCINGGIYIISRAFLQAEIDAIQPNYHTNELHFSDLINRATDLGKQVSMITVPFDQVRGINTNQELWAVEQIKRSELIKYWMDRGVRFSAAQTVHLDLDVQIGAGTYIGCSVHLLDGTKIGTNSRVDAFSMVENSTIGNNVTVYSHSVLTNATVGDHSKVGPFAHVQQNTHIGNNVTIGNFVETKNSTIGNHSKAKHLTYLGNATLGTNVNIGAGTITCNYDGTKKHATIIKDHVFVGTNTSLVAPLTINEGSFTAAGSVITEDVPKDSLAIGRARQVNKEGYAKKIRAQESESLSFIAAIKSPTDAPTSDQ